MHGWFGNYHICFSFLVVQKAQLGMTTLVDSIHCRTVSIQYKTNLHSIKENGKLSISVNREGIHDYFGDRINGYGKVEMNQDFCEYNT